MDTVVVSALVAAVVTLGIEYFAKPSLEARKDRIVEQHRTRREVLRSYNKLVFDVARLTVHLREEGTPVTYRHSQIAELNELIRDESKRLRSLVAAGGRELRDLEEAGVFLFGSALQGYVAVLARHGDDDPTGWVYVLELLDPITDLVEQALATPRWRWRLRQRRVRAVHEFSAAT